MYNWGTPDNGDDRDEEAEEDMSAEQYLREMEKILRKIRRREVRKRAFNKYYKGNKKIDLIRSNCAT